MVFAQPVWYGVEVETIKMTFVFFISVFVSFDISYCSIIVLISLFRLCVLFSLSVSVYIAYALILMLIFDILQNIQLTAADNINQIRFLFTHIQY